MSETKFAAVRELVAEAQYEEARAILRTINTPESQYQLEELDKIDPSMRFSVDSSLLFQLGEQLVTKPSIALAELVKNAYDADATEVTITMENIGTPGGNILVEDNGHGMTLDEIKNGWMRIATVAKRETQTSRFFCRPLTGAKGVGRFAARRLGSKLTMQSVARTNFGTTESVVVEFDWFNNFKSGADIDRIPLTFSRREVDPNTSTGVSLLVENTYDPWTISEVNQLRRDLVTLQSPFPKMRTIRTSSSKCIPDLGFDIRFSITGKGGLETLSGTIGDAFINTAVAVLDGKIDGSGRGHYAIRLCSSGETDGLIDSHNDYAGLAGAKFRIYYLVYSRDEISDFSVSTLREKGRAQGGVALYIDGFRVFPYGEPSDDWLQLDEYAGRNVDMAQDINPSSRVLELARSPETGPRPYLLLPRNYNLFGAVSLSQTLHPNIQLNVSRQRLIDNPTVLSLRKFVQNGIYWMTMKYAAATEPRRSTKRTVRKQTLPSLLEAAKDRLESVVSPISTTTLSDRDASRDVFDSDVPETVVFPRELIEEVSAAIGEAAEQARVEEIERISERSMLRLLASAGTTLMIMNHQLRHLISAVLQIQQDLQRMRTNIPLDAVTSFDDVVERVGEWHEMVDAQVSQLALLIAADRTEKRQPQLIYQIMEDVKRPMNYYMTHYGVTFENNLPRDLRTPPIFAAELYTILLNILSNALKAVTDRPDRRIAVSGGRRFGEFFMQMKDTGIGVPKEKREQVFEPFVTTSLTNPLLGVGTGLGLSVVRDTLALYDGKAQFIDTEPPWRTCIEIILPSKGK